MMARKPRTPADLAADWSDADIDMRTMEAAAGIAMTRCPCGALLLIMVSYEHAPLACLHMPADHVEGFLSNIGKMGEMPVPAGQCLHEQIMFQPKAGGTRTQ